ncbi:hypothetical protein CLV63_12144 [Murinocardiopsis flavida]|uniref:Uncharacterized protein n=1 Tax=Murinocardiopsis flavida TaxID=645275 RepID=A0A2P8D127_9ACTN|nr:hypothetical protein [Murinocardiopsis flavida]PSK90919.1 hypothetical protein CLV63_12144 [Murinocardiopsis flavida]
MSEEPRGDAQGPGRQGNLREGLTYLSGLVAAAALLAAAVLLLGPVFAWGGGDEDPRDPGRTCSDGMYEALSTPSWPEYGGATCSGDALVQMRYAVLCGLISVPASAAWVRLSLHRT